MIVSGTHDRYLVFLSIAVAVFASFTALSLANRIRASRGQARRLWLSGAAIALGGGIWAMHFVAMLAFSMPGMAMSYDPGLTLASLVIAIAFTGAGLAIVDWQRVVPARIAGAGLLIGAGVVAMHYIGMAAMRMPATLGYDWRWVAASVVIAVAAATAAMWLASTDRQIGRRLLAATVMGAAIAGMHYSGMAAAVFVATRDIDHAQGTASANQTYLAVGISVVTVLIMLLSLGAAQVEAMIRRAARREARTALRLKIADILRGHDADEALGEVAAVLGEYFGVVRVGLGDLDSDADVFDYRICWTDGSVAPLVGQMPAVDFGVKVVAALDAGRTVAIDDLFDHPLSDDMLARDTARTVDTRAILVVPFVREGRLRTIVYLNDRHPRAWRQDEVVFMEEVAERIRLVTERVDAENALRDLNASLEARVEARTRELQQAEEALRHAQKMEAMGQLTGGVAHDFNNLLTPIMGALDRLHHKGLADSRDARLVAGALQSAERARTLVHRLLSFARRQPLNPVPVDIAVLTRGVLDLIATTIGPRYRVEVDAARDVPPAMADAGQLEMALLNLCVNARDAMPEGGDIRIVIDHLRLDDDVPGGAAPGGYVRLCVVDSGVGMDAETRQRAIEPFFSTKGVGRGTGLGLSMAHGLAAQLGGMLTIDSAPGEGTRICFCLPESLTMAPAATTTSPGAASCAGGRVLLVDDEEQVREATAQMLSDLGYHVRAVASGREAVALMEGGEVPDVVVSDHMMPGMTGVELARIVRDVCPGARFLLISGYAEGGIDGDVPRLPKPFVKADLAASLSDLV
ncbi:MHYT domain-containing protein [Sphingomonas floccifaciens]|uniref:histidine kinase n=1 Tax=Sphingomonas floccifaciens TaxID=1844115 RepID=A0ABW4NDW8_9SPHN